MNRFMIKAHTKVHLKIFDILPLFEDRPWQTYIWTKPINVMFMQSFWLDFFCVWWFFLLLVSYATNAALDTESQNYLNNISVHDKKSTFCVSPDFLSWNSQWILVPGSDRLTFPCWTGPIGGRGQRELWFRAISGLDNGNGTWNGHKRSVKRAGGQIQNLLSTTTQ